LGRTGSGAAPALPTLLGIAKGGGDLGNRARALGAIGAIGPEAASAVPSLIGALECEGKEEILARYAAGALAKLGAAAVKPLAEALQSRHPHVRRQAATALGQIGPAAKEAEAALRKAAEDGEETVRKAAQEALAALKPKE
jgi:HEAT repeat protein